MEALVFILIVVFSILLGKNENKKKAGAAKPAAKAGSVANARNAAPVKQAASKPVRQAAARRDPALFKRRLEALKQQAEAKLEEVSKALDAPPAKPAAAPAAQPVFAQGGSLSDDEGCVGGSMAHEHTEGETRAEHRRHVEELHRREAEETRATLAAQELAELNVQRMRRAVVMAEILDKPVALRRGRR